MNEKEDADDLHDVFVNTFCDLIFANYIVINEHFLSKHFYRRASPKCLASFSCSILRLWPHFPSFWLQT